MAHSYPTMPQTVEAYKELAQRDLAIIEEQRAEIGSLKATINKLRQANEKLKRKAK